MQVISNIANKNNPEVLNFDTVDNLMAVKKNEKRETESESGSALKVNKTSLMIRGVGEYVGIGQLQKLLP